MSSYEHIIVEKERGRARIIFNRPERHNAISGRTSRERTWLPAPRPTMSVLRRWIATGASP